jgi:hypothetical protein
MNAGYRNNSFNLDDLGQEEMERIVSVRRTVIGPTASVAASPGRPRLAGETHGELC